MKVTDLLQEEHDTILRALGLVESATEHVRRGLPLASACKTWIASFICQFVDGCHFAKEEQLLFPLLKRRGMPLQGAPIAWSQHEHDLCRQLAGKMTAALNGDDLPAFVRSAEEYVALLRQHILKESNMLLVLAAGLLSVEDHKHLILAFKQHDQAAPVCRKHLVRDMVHWASALAEARGRQTERAAKESLQARPRAAAMR